MRRVIPALLAVLLPAAAAAQPAKGTVRIDFRAMTEDGQQITDLKADEISLKVNGKPRTLQALNVFQSANSAPPVTGALPAPYTSNSGSRNGRILHLLIDDDSITPGRETQLRDAVRMLLAELAPADRIGVLTPQGQLNIGPTDDRAKIKLAVDGLTGKAPTQELEAEAQCRTVHVLRALGTLLAVQSATPTTIVVFGGGLSPPNVKQVAVGRTNRTPVGGREADPSSVNDVCRVEPETYENIGAIAAIAHADIYVFHLTEAMANRSTTQDSGVESLAGATGAEFARLSASPQSAVTRLLRETSAYYTASFEPDANERNGQTLRVELKSTRDKVRLRARPSIQMPKGDGGKASAAANSPKDMLRVRTEYSDLPLRASAHTSRLPGSEEIRVVSLFEGIDGTPLTAASVGLFDEKNTLKKQWTAQKEDLAKRPIRADLQTPAGTYRVRVAAVDANGRAGTTDYELKAETVRADPLKLSSLVVGTQAQGFAPRLEFTTEQVAIGYLEIYSVPKGGTVTVDLDVVQTPEGAPLATAPTEVRAGASEDSRIAIGGFSIAGLAPGDYLMRAVVSLDGKPVGKVVRTVRKAQ